MRFNEWLDTFIQEKGLDTEKVFEVNGPIWGINFIPCAVVIEHIKIASKDERDAIKTMIVKLDFVNADIMDYFKHLAKAIAR